MTYSEDGKNSHDEKDSNPYKIKPLKNCQLLFAVVCNNLKLICSHVGIFRI